MMETFYDSSVIAHLFSKGSTTCLTSKLVLPPADSQMEHS